MSTRKPFLVPRGDDPPSALPARRDVKRCLYELTPVSLANETRPRLSFLKARKGVQVLSNIKTSFSRVYSRRLLMFNNEFKRFPCLNL